MEVKATGIGTWVWWAGCMYPVDGDDGVGGKWLAGVGATIEDAWNKRDGDDDDELRNSTEDSVVHEHVDTIDKHLLWPIVGDLKAWLGVDEPSVVMTGDDIGEVAGAVLTQVAYRMVRSALTSWTDRRDNCDDE